MGEFLVGDGVHEAVEADAAIGRSKTHSRQCVVGTRSIVARTLGRVVPYEDATCRRDATSHTPRIVHSDDEVLGCIVVGKVDHRVHIVEHHYATVLKRARSNVGTREQGQLASNLHLYLRRQFWTVAHEE